MEVCRKIFFLTEKSITSEEKKFSSREEKNTTLTVNKILSQNQPSTLNFGRRVLNGQNPPVPLADQL